MSSSENGLQEFYTGINSVSKLPQKSIGYSPEALQSIKNGGPIILTSEQKAAFVEAMASWSHPVTETLIQRYGHSPESVQNYINDQQARSARYSPKAIIKLILNPLAALISR